MCSTPALIDPLAVWQVLSTSFFTVRCGLLAAEGVESILAQTLRQILGRSIAPAEGGWGMVRSCRRALMHVETAAYGAAGAATGAAICMQRFMAYLAGDMFVSYGMIPLKHADMKTSCCELLLNP